MVASQGHKKPAGAFHHQEVIAAGQLPDGRGDAAQVHRPALPGRGHPRGQGQPQSYGGEQLQGLVQTGQFPGKGGIGGQQPAPVFRAAALDGLKIDGLNLVAPQGRGQAGGDHRLAHIGVGASDQDAPEFR